MSEDAPWLVVGLGNPGPKYAGNRHNIGFMVAETWAEDIGGAFIQFRDAFKARLCTVDGSHSGHPQLGRCLVLLPQTFMNRSGESVAAAANYYRVPVNQVLVIHDELDFVPGRIAVKNGGGHGGHNGLRDIVRALGSNDFLRIRVGIGRPPHGGVSGWVLSDFQSDEMATVSEAVERSAKAVSSVIMDGVQTAMNQFNSTTN